MGINVSNCEHCVHKKVCGKKSSLQKQVETIKSVLATDSEVTVKVTCDNFYSDAAASIDSTFSSILGNIK